MTGPRGISRKEENMAHEKNIIDRAVDVACRRWARTNPAGAASWEGMSPNRQDLLIHRMAGVVEALRDHDLLATPEHDAEQRRAGAVQALRDAADAMLECKRPGHWNLDAQPGSDTGYSPDVWLRARADRIEAQHG